MKISKIDNVNEYLNIINEIRYEYANTKTGGDIWYRGVSNLEYKLIPKLFRKNNDKMKNNTYSINLELSIIEHFVREASVFNSNLSIERLLECIVVAQHYGVPTRLLDFTENPLVALYFACESQKDKDAMVYVIRPHYLGSSMLEKADNNEEFIRCDDFIKNVVVSELNTESPKYDYPIEYVPIYLDARMQGQSSRFLIWGNLVEDLESILSNENYMEIHNGIKYGAINDPRCYHKIKIKSTSKNSIINQLDTLGINEKTIFPGLDGVGRYIDRLYNMTQEDYVTTFLSI